jgi:hypothetical protein
VTARGVSTLDRFMAKVYKTETCWLWTAAKATNGYGMFGSLNDVTTAHRWAHELFIGPIPEGMDVDHLCRVRECVNPEHLEAVTRIENLRRMRVGRKLGHTVDGLTRILPTGVSA